ncbi:dTDP-4-amino-4,6-dideoxygalactose transaminase [Aestuariivivens sediminis]|uniref:dTDP-4-amino-4,6-dideoxygalactose transaminase n=1 Tax=Aestuariivivens sediminis TaxID=2913557 RepID=UPI001F56DDF6|nr:dTDP-4-amino-4,6-dideoxygalactose transaminase [Aestuariivivens sediminis]
MIPFNKPFLTGNEINYIQEAVSSGKLSGNGIYTKKCQSFFENRYGIHKALLTSSCTDALEMAAILLDIQSGDEVIVPSYTFVSTANAFVLRGAKIVFADSSERHPNVDAALISNLITSKTKAIIVMHYAGVACDMDAIMAIANAHNLFVVEDAAQAIESYYKGRALGSIGHIATFSFHETKNVIAGEGGLLAVNDPSFAERAEIIWEKGTNRASFFRGEINKYGWVDIGSSFLASELSAAFLWAQLEAIDQIQAKRLLIWNQYYKALQNIESAKLQLPILPDYATNNGHLFYLLCTSIEQRQALINHLKTNGILAVFHYVPLHNSTYIKSRQGIYNLPNADRFSDCLLRLPLFYTLTPDEQTHIVASVKDFFNHG